MMPSAAESLLDKLAGVPVLCVGDIILDQYIHGKVERISPEAPVPVLHVEQESVVLGGAGNVARNISALGGHCHLIGVVGNDRYAETITQLLEEKQTPIRHSLLHCDKRPTTQKKRYVVGIQQVFRADEEYVGYISDALEKAVIAAAAALMEQCKTLILSDYGKGVLRPSLCQQLIAMAHQHTVPVIVDPKGRDYRKYSGATFITPNRKELQQATGVIPDSDTLVEAAAQTIIHEHDVRGVLATRSDKGMSLISRDGSAAHIPTKAREVFDVSGAGDTVVAVFAMALAAKGEPLTAMLLANAAAGVVVAKPGTAVASMEEIRQQLTDRRHHMVAAEQKIHSLTTLKPVLRQLENRNRRIGFTNGCFDLLHAGHVRYLQYARRSCDYLVLGLNSDASVRKLKGDSRPVNSEQHRAEVLAALACIDAVVVFDEDTPLSLITAIQPDVLIKGADYTRQQVVGADIVEAKGGKVILAPLLDGVSTTRTIHTIQKTG